MSKNLNSSVGSESFVDVIANLIGVLVVLVAIVGIHVRTQATLENEPERLEKTLGELIARLTALEQELDSLRADRIRLRNDLDKQKAEAKALEQELTTLLQAQHEVASQSAKLEEEVRDLRIGVARHRERDARGVASVPEERRLVLKAPVSRPVGPGEAELHFELQQARVTYLPIQSLLAAARVKRQDLQPVLERTGQAEGVVGPIGDFVLRFKVALDEQALARRVLVGAGPYQARLVEWTLVPVKDQRGEPVDVAIGNGGSLRRLLAGRNPKTTFITVWVYPDSFAEFRRLRDALYELGYFVAARPLPDGIPIAGSIDGTRSYAQ